MHVKSVLVVDDDPALLQLVEQLFHLGKIQVHSAASGQEGLREFYTHQPDLVILDLMMPGMDGCTVCQRIRQVSDVPIIMLTAMNRENDIIRALDYGADDYVTKPFSHNVLLARTRAALRRARVSAPPKTPFVYHDNHLIIDQNKHRVFVDGQAVKLTAIEFRLLTYLFQNAGRVLNFRQILNNVWGEEYQGNTEYVHVYIQRLRRKLEIDPSSPTYILTEHGVGYRFEKSSD